MERNFDEVIAEMLIQLAAIERNIEQENERMESFDKRMDLTIRRMVKAESRLEASEKRMELFDQKLEKSIERMELFDQKLERSIERIEQSIKDQKEFSHMQSNMNKYFLDYIKNNGNKS